MRCNNVTHKGRSASRDLPGLKIFRFFFFFFAACKKRLYMSLCDVVQSFLCPWQEPPTPCQFNTAELKRLHLVCDGRVTDLDCKYELVE